MISYYLKEISRTCIQGDAREEFLLHDSGKPDI